MKRIHVIGINPTGFDWGQLKFLAYLVPLALVMLLPLVFIMFNAFKPLDELFLYPPRFVTTPRPCKTLPISRLHRSTRRFRLALLI